MKPSQRQGVLYAADAGKAVLVAALCLSMAAPQAYAAEPIHGHATPPAVKTVPLTAQQKTLHALNRLTFGPRPGDEQAVAKMGLEKWFEQQLHPESLDDSALAARLDQYPALKLSQAELIRRFPSPQVIRQMSAQNRPLPNDPVEHAIYADAMAMYDQQLKKQAAGQGAGANAAAGAQTDAMMTANDTNTGAQDESMSPAAGSAAAGQNQQQTMAGDQSMANAGKKKQPKFKAGRRPDVAPMEPEDVRAVLTLDPDQRIAKLLAMSPDEMMSFRAGLRPVQRALLARGLSPAQVEILGAMQAPVRVVGAEALSSRLLRDVYSERQLQAVMTDFWLNHFSVYAKKNANEPYYLAAYERDTILPNAMGKFEDLLVATAKSPAMLIYLDNFQSIGPDSLAAQRVKRFGKFAPNAQVAQFLPKGLNENYARELMELHTLGVNGGYTQKDVIEVAKCFTGWTIDRPYQGGSFSFEPNRHEGGSKTVLGQTISSGGEEEGLKVLHMLATSPATAHFVSNKLAVRFVSDTPPPALVDRMAQTFLKTDGDIKAVLSTMFHSQEFWSPQVYRAKLKTPIEFMTSALRASDAQVQNPLPLVQAMEQLGMPIYGMQTPNGYPWNSEPWANSNALVSRMNFAIVLGGSRIPGTHTDWQQLTGEPVDAANAQAEHKLETVILGRPAADRTRETVLAQASNPSLQRDAAEKFALRAGDGDEETPLNTNVLMKKVSARQGQGANMMRADLPETPLDTMAGLLLGSPDFQRR
ncbi:MAG TPA: DUF1800 domain-containing protein [Acidobacteriaceae bacterium]|jgi:uncharacterized protein (DUF1800 family)